MTEIKHDNVWYKLVFFFLFDRQADILAVGPLRINRPGRRALCNFRIGEGQSQHNGIHVDEGRSAVEYQR